jgi:hypothetical protein
MLRALRTAGDSIGAITSTGTSTGRERDGTSTSTVRVGTSTSTVCCRYEY